MKNWSIVGLLSCLSVSSITGFSADASAQVHSAPTVVLGQPQEDKANKDLFGLPVACSMLVAGEECYVQWVVPGDTRQSSMTGKGGPVNVWGLQKGVTYNFTVNASSATTPRTSGAKSPVVSYKYGQAVPTPPPPVAWTDIGSQTQFASVSAGSASKLVGTSTAWSDGNNYVLNSSGANFEYYKQPNSTDKLVLVQTSIGADGTWWGVKADGTVWRNMTTSWSKVPTGSLKQVSVGNATNIWGVSATNVVYKWSGSSWTKMAGELTNIAVASDGTVWGVTPGSAIVKWNGTTWTTIPGSAVQVAVGSASIVYAVNSAGTVAKWNGTNWDVVSDAGNCKAVAAAADGTLLVLRSSSSTPNTVFRKP
ncbi:MAG: hypothetical protein QM778_07325 [Myxococcales bacterium]